MAQQIKKKYIQDDAIDGEKLKLVKDQSVRGEDQQGQEVDLLKLDQDDKVLLKGEEAALKSQVDAEQARAEGEESRIEGKLDQEVLDRIAGDNDVRSEFAQADTDLHVVISQEIDADVLIEKNRAEGEEQRIEAKLDQEVLDRISGDDTVRGEFAQADTALHSTISAEIDADVLVEKNRAEGEESRIEGKVDQEVLDRQSEITRVEGLVSDEETRAIGEESRIEGKLDQEVLDRQTLEGEFDQYVIDNNQALSDEQAARISGDQSLQSNIDTEEAARISGDQNLQSNIDTEEAARIAGDANLQSQIDNIVSNTDPSALDSLSEIVDAFQNADSDLQQSITDVLGQHTSELNAYKASNDPRVTTLEGEMDSAEGRLDVVEADLSQEIQDRTNADSTLQSNIDSEASARQNADSTLQSNIDSEASTRQSADNTLQSNIDAEASTRESADNTLQSNIDTEEAARIAGDADLQSKLDVEETRARIAEETLQSNIDAEAVSRENADNTLQSNIDSEQSRAEGQEAAIRSEFAAADQTLDSKIDQEISDRQQAISDEEQSRIDGDNALDARMVPMEEILEYQKSVAYEDSAAVYADAAPGREDANLREGWYYSNDGQDGFNKINWYFHDGQKNQVTLGDFSAYAVMTFDDASESPILAVYTFPTGTNDAASWYHSRMVYSGLSATPEVGKQYLVHFGQDPQIHPELPRLQLSMSSQNTVGDQNPAEIVMTSSFGTNSVAPVGAVKFLVEHLGVYSPSFKSDVKLKIHHATQQEFDALQSQVNALDEGFVTEEEFSQGISDLQAEIDADVLVEKNRAEGEEARIQGELDAYKSSNDQALSDEVSARQTLEGEFDQYVIDNDQALAQEVQDRTNADSNLQGQIDTEKGRIDAILEASTADADSFKEIVDLINSVDTENDQAFAGYVSSNDARVLAVEGEVDTLQSEMDTVEARLDTAEPKISTLESEMDAVEGRLDIAEPKIVTLESEMDAVEGRLDIAEPKILTLEGEMDAVEGRLDVAEPKISTLESEMDTVEANLAQELIDRAAGDQNLQDQIDQINTDVSQVVQFAKESITVTSQMLIDGYVDLSNEAKPNSMVMFVGRLAMHEGAGLDYTLSTVNGVTRITFEAQMLEPSEEALEANQVIRVTYSK